MNPPQTSLPLTIAATSIGFVVIQLDVTIVNIALAQISARLGASVSSLQWVVDAYALVFAALLLSAGALGDRLGARRVFVAGLLVFTVASAACGLAQTDHQLIAARALQGLGAAMIMPNSLALLNHACAGDSITRARALGLWNAAGGLAVAAGPVLGGLMIASTGWRSIFLINLPVCAMGIWLTYRFVDETPPTASHRNLDLPGQTLAIVSLLALTSSIIGAGSVGWQDPRTLGGLSLACLCACLFFYIEIRSPHPMLPLGFFRNPAFSAATAAGFLNNLAYYGLIFVLSLYFQTIRHYSTVLAGLAFVPLTGTVTISNIIGSRLAGRTGPRLPMTLGFLIAAVGYGSLSGIDAQTSYLAMVLPLAIIPFGLGLAIPPMTSALLSTVERNRSGIASATFTTVRQIGGAIGVAVFGTLVSHDASASIRGIQDTFLICMCLSALAALVSRLGIGRTEPAISPQREQPVTDD